MQGQFEAVFAKKPGLEWEEIFSAVSVPYGNVRELPEVLAEPHVESRNALHSAFILSLNETIRFPGLVCTIGGENGRERSALPELSANADDILRETGYLTEEIENLKRKGVTLWAGRSRGTSFSARRPRSPRVWWSANT